MSKREQNVEENNTTTIDHIVTDQGNGAALCGNCEYVLGYDPLKMPQYKNCPSCNYAFVGNSLYVQQGGSDF